MLEVVDVTYINVIKNYFSLNGWELAFLAFSSSLVVVGHLGYYHVNHILQKLETDHWF